MRSILNIASYIKTLHIIFFMNKKCQIYDVANLLGKKWSLQILLELCKGKNAWKRYSEIKRKIPKINPRAFSLRLKGLEKEGLIKKKVSVKSFPIKSKYSLTKSGRDFVKVIDAMKKWTLKWKKIDKECKKILCEQCKR